jgi:hypothetical protein
MASVETGAANYKKLGTSLSIGAANRNKGVLPSGFNEFDVSITFSEFETWIEFFWENIVGVKLLFLHLKRYSPASKMDPAESRLIP